MSMSVGMISRVESMYSGRWKAGVQPLFVPGGRAYDIPCRRGRASYVPTVHTSTCMFHQKLFRVEYRVY